jgi:hypothetical protein
MDKSKIVDLEISSDGSYAPKRAKEYKPKRAKEFIHHAKEDKPKYLLRNDADDFLNGIDIGLDFVETIGTRVNRFLGLKIMK